MNRHIPSHLILAFAIVFFGTGLPYWIIPYDMVTLPNALLSPGLLIACIAALLLQLYKVTSFWKGTGVITSAVAAVVFARVIFEVVLDPTSHNLWPFEVIIALFVGFASTLPGSVAGLLFEKFSRRD